MDSHQLQKLVQQIVANAANLKDRYTNEKNAPVNYACVFAQSENEYQELTKAAQALGPIIKETDTGHLYHIQDLETVSGPLRILKIRTPDPSRLERGDADFSVANYAEFKEQYLPQSGFALIPRQEMEMIELVEPDATVRAYFSNPPIDQQLLIK